MSNTTNQSRLIMRHDGNAIQTSNDTSRYDVVVVTTAALPWLTGPSYLSIWHACGLTHMGYRTLYIVPWLSPASQQRLWGKAHFTSPQKYYQWLSEEAAKLGCPALPDFSCYHGYYQQYLRSIVPMENIFSIMPESDYIVLEEPEHLAWHLLTTPRRKIAAKKVIGLQLTNYEYYVHRGLPIGLKWISKLVAGWHRTLIRRHTDVVVPISPSIPMDKVKHPYSEVRISGVLAPYAEVPPVQPDTLGVYFLGRVVWDKGFVSLIEIAQKANLAIDVYGDGADTEAVAKLARQRGVTLRLLGPHASFWTVLHQYRIFLNPSLSEVLCTATADALVAGRHVVLPRCPGNIPFYHYPNVHLYDDIDGAIAALRHALSEPPKPPDEIRHDFNWHRSCQNLASLWES